MNRKEIKDILFEMGASSRLLEMPAIMERIYNYYIDYSEDELKKEIKIGPNGEIECKTDNHYNKYTNGIIRKFSEIEKGEAVFENYEQQGIEQKGKYYIDKFGMDKMFTSDSNPLFEQECTVVRTTEGMIEVNRGRKVIEDQGDPILNYNNYTVLKQNSSRTIGVDGNRKFLTKYYPITREWFEIREGIKIEETIVDEHNDEVKGLENRIRTIEEQHKEEINKIIEEKEMLQRMLKRTLNVCEEVKRSALGKIFFGKKLKELPEALNRDER